MAGESSRAAAPATEPVQGGILLTSDGLLDRFAEQQASGLHAHSATGVAKLAGMCVVQAVVGADSTVSLTMTDHGIAIVGMGVVKTIATGDANAILTVNNDSNPVVVVDLNGSDAGDGVSAGATSAWDAAQLVVAKGGVLEFVTSGGASLNSCSVSVYGIPVS